MTEHPALPPHATRVEDVAARFATDPAAGLTTAEATARLQRFGRNAPNRPERPRYAAIAGRQLADPIVAYSWSPWWSRPRSANGSKRSRSA